MSQKDKGKQSNNIQDFKKFNEKIQSRITQCLKIQPRKKSRCISHRRIVLIITAGQMMMPETLLDV